MAVIKCKMCGGDLNISEGSSVVECEYCGTRQTVPCADNEKKMTLFARAGRLLRGCEFDKSSGVFESIVADFPEEAEAYWGLVLCKYGIEYVDDPATGKKVPTCHRSSFDSVLDDPNFEQACENGDVIARRVYREEARQIEELRKGIIEVSGKEAPYDIFISYKETDDQGNRTLDSVIAQDLYNELTEKGYRVFFSRISLEDKLGVEYEPYIFAALNSARLMLVVGTDYEHFDAVWVKNEWSRFLKLISSGQKKVLIPVFKNMDPYDMPKEFAKLSAQDMGKVGAMQDLLRGVEKILGGKTEEKKETVVVQQSSGPNVQALLKRGEMALADGKWDDAKGYYDRVLDMDAECGEAYLGLFLVEQKTSSVDALVAGQLTELKTCTTKKLTACDQQEERIRKAIQDNVVPGYLDEKELQLLFTFDRSYQSSLTMRGDQLQKKEKLFNENRTLNRAKQYATPEQLEKLKGMEDAVLGFLKDAIAKAQAEDEANIARITAEYAAHLEKAEDTASRMGQEARSKREADYEEACRAFEQASEPRDYMKLSDLLERLNGYKNSEEIKKRCEDALQRLKEQEEKKAKEKKKKFFTAAGITAVLAVAVFMLVTKVIIPQIRYNEATERLSIGEYPEAAMLYYQAGDYKDSKARYIEAGQKAGMHQTLSAGSDHTVGLKSDGTVVAVGDNAYGVSDWTDIRFYISLAAVLVAFCVIALVVPFVRTAAFWVSFAFGVAAIGIQVYTMPRAMAGNTRSKFYGFPILRISFLYLAVQLGLSLLFMALAKWAPVWVPVVLYLLLLCTALIGFVGADSVREEVERQDVQAKRQVSVMRALQSKARAIAAQCEGDEARKAVTRLSEDLSYSDPVSSPAIADAETELAACIDNLQQAVVDGSEEEILALCRKAAAALAERNRLCKLNKG